MGGIFLFIIKLLREWNKNITFILPYLFFFFYIFVPIVSFFTLFFQDTLTNDKISDILSYLFRYSVLTAIGILRYRMRNNKVEVFARFELIIEKGRTFFDALYSCMDFYELFEGFCLVCMNTRVPDLRFQKQNYLIYHLIQKLIFRLFFKWV